MPSPLALTAAALELTMMLAGLALIVRWFVTGGARRHRSSAALTPWPTPSADFAVFVGFVIAGWFFCLSIAGFIAVAMKMGPNTRLIFVGGASQVGWLAGALLHRRLSLRNISPFAPQVSTPPPPFLSASATVAPPAPPLLDPSFARSVVEAASSSPVSPPPPAELAPAASFRAVVMPGLATFLMVLPLLTGVSLAWRFFLTQCGYPVKSQELVALFKKPDSPWLLAAMIVLAVIVAPIAEEIVFRAGIFRFLRGRVGYALALLAPAIVFSAMHANVASFLPLVVLAVVFSLGYERTGHIGTTIVAHALFNLNTIVLLVSGVSDLTPT